LVSKPGSNDERRSVSPTRPNDPGDHRLLDDHLLNRGLVRERRAKNTGTDVPSCPAPTVATGPRDKGAPRDRDRRARPDTELEPVALEGELLKRNIRSLERRVLERALLERADRDRGLERLDILLEG
jgi:hypothetical protein